MAKEMTRADYVATNHVDSAAHGFDSAEGVTEHPEATTVQQWFRDSSDFSQMWRDKATESYRFYSPDSNFHWNADDREILEEQGRPVLSFNRQKPMIDAVAGFEASNGQDVKYIPRHIGAGGATEIYTEAARYFRELTFADDNDSDAFQDATICGYGYTHNAMDYLEDPQGLCTIKRKSPLLHYFDPLSTEYNLRDRNWMIYLDFVPKERARQRFGDIVDEITAPPSGTGRDQAIHQLHKTVTKNFGIRWGEITILRCEYWLIGEVYLVADPVSGSTFELAPSSLLEKGPDGLTMREMFDANGIEYVKTERKAWHTVYVSGSTILQRVEHKNNTPAINPMTGYRDEIEGIHYGLMEVMKDPAKWSNKFMSSFIDIFQSASKGGLMYESSAVEDVRDLEERWASNDATIALKDGGLHRVKEREQGQMPAAIDRLLNIAVSAVSDVTKINLEFLGMANRDQSGKVELERKRAVTVVLARLLKNNQSYRRAGGKILLEFMRAFIPSGRLIRIRGPEGDQYQHLIKSPEYITYDVVTDLSPDSESMKAEAWATLKDLLPAMAANGVPIPPSIIKYLPLPESITQEWMNFINQPPGKEEMLDMAVTEADREEKVSRAKLNLARAEEHGSNIASKPRDQMIDMFNALTKRIDALEKRKDDDD